MFTITIDAGIFARNALAVLIDGGMAFQSDAARTSGNCRYLHADGSRCAIGAGLPVEGLERLDPYQISAPVGTLLRTGVFRVTSAMLPQAELRPLLAKIQAIHDSLMLRGLTPQEVAERAATLAALLEDLAALHPEAESKRPHPFCALD
jgi:hypothetical protein